MKQRNVISDALSEVLRKLGFKKQGRRIWTVENDDVIWFVELQACWYGSGRYFVNLGVVLKKLDVQSYVGHGGAHGVFRLERVLPTGDQDRFNRNELNLHSLILTDDQKKASIIHWLEDVALPKLFRCNSLQAAQMELKDDDLYSVRYPTRQALWPEKG